MNKKEKVRIGLTLSGGGFRATLFHLGVVRFLRDCDLLKQVSHVTSVSGGSILAAHLVLNWERYCGTPEEFDQAAQEILQFIDLDIRNRILRRYPLLLGIGIYSAILRRKRVLKITGLLEKYYQKYLFGDLCLHQLPTTPELHILCTNVSGGGLSSFSRNGILIEQPSTSGRREFKQYRGGLAKIITAVAASSAFPGFFPPMAIWPQDIGAFEGEFPTQFFTDGGVYDNLGIRMLDYLGIESENHISPEDFLDVEGCIQAWNKCLEDGDSTSLSRLVGIANSLNKSEWGASNTIKQPQHLLEKLNLLLSKGRLHEDAELLERLGHLKGNQAKSLEGLVSSQTLLTNKECIATAFKQAVGYDCIKPPEGICDLILVSDAGTDLTITGSHQIQGFLSTAMRSADILMDRVRQLERNNFSHAKQCTFISVTDIVPQEFDPSALHPEIQVQVARIRTDLDRFSKLEISSLVQHGYCVARHICRSLNLMISSHVPEGRPWNPFSNLSDSNKASDSTLELHHQDRITKAAKTLQKSSNRQIVESLFDLKDWITWVYIPLIVLLLGVMPYFAYRNYRHAQLYFGLSENIALMSDDFGRMLELIEKGLPKEFISTQFEEVNSLSPNLETPGFNLVRETQITDLRKWVGRSPTSPRQVYVFLKFDIVKTSESTQTASLRLPSPWNSPNLLIQFETQRFNPILRRYNTSPTGDAKGPFIWEIVLDLNDIQVHEVIEFSISMIQTSSNGNLPFKNTEWSSFVVKGQPKTITSWTLLPRNYAIDSFNVVRFQNETPDVMELVEPTRSALMRRGSVIYWKLLQPEPNSTYSTNLRD